MIHLSVINSVIKQGISQEVTTQNICNNFVALSHHAS